MDKSQIHICELKKKNKKLVPAGYIIYMTMYNSCV